MSVGNSEGRRYGKIVGETVWFGLVFRRALYGKTGDWYHILREDPVTLLDRDGYI